MSARRMVNRVYGFPGEVSRAPGMGRDLFDRFPTHTRAAESLLGYSLRHICLADDTDLARQVATAQPAMYVVCVLAYLDRIREDPTDPAFFIGHGVGEYAALFAAGAFDFETGLELVRRRGELMARAAEGEMAAVIGCDCAAVEPLLQGAGVTGVDLAGVDAPRQTVLAGPSDDVARARLLLEAHGAMCVPLHVGAPLHSRYMRAAAEDFARELGHVHVRAPRVPVIASVSGRPHRYENVREMLVRQIVSPVRWMDGIRFIMDQGSFAFDELGPGHVLTRLVCEIRRDETAGKPPLAPITERWTPAAPLGTSVAFEWSVPPAGGPVPSTVRSAGTRAMDVAIAGEPPATESAAELPGAESTQPPDTESAAEAPVTESTIEMPATESATGLDHGFARSALDPASDDIAVIGASVELPGARTLDELWRILVRGERRIGPYPERRWAALPAAWTAGRRREAYVGAFLDDVDAFDHRLFETSPREAMLLDPQHRMALASVWAAIEDAGYERTELSRKTTAVLVAIGPDDYAGIADHAHGIDELRGPGVFRYMAAHRISHFFDLEGASETVDSACSSVFVAIERACAALRSGTCEQAIVTGVQLNLDPRRFDALAQQGLLSATGRTASFDDTADGFARAEGVGTVILKPLRSAIDDGDHVHAVIKGAGIWHAGRAAGLDAPCEGAHRRAMTRALAESGIDAGELSYIEAHGTAMRVGDASEIAAFASVLHESRGDPAAPCVVSAAKSTLGHLETASGMAALLKAILVLKKGLVPGVAGLANVRPDLDLRSFRLSAQAQALPARRAPGGPYAGLHAYGPSGVSSFVVLGKAPDRCRVVPGPVQVARGHVRSNVLQGPVQVARGHVRSNVLQGSTTAPELFALSAASHAVLIAYLERIRDFVAGAALRGEALDFPAFVAAYRSRRRAMRARLAMVTTCTEHWLRCADAVLGGRRSSDVYRSEDASGAAIASAADVARSVDARDWHAVARAWVGGASVAWPDAHRARRPFPTYPFDHTHRFWARSTNEEAMRANAPRSEPAGRDISRDAWRYSP